MEFDVELVGAGCDVLGLFAATVGAYEGGPLVGAIPDLDVVTKAVTTPLKTEVLELEEHLLPMGHLNLPHFSFKGLVVPRVAG